MQQEYLIDHFWIKIFIFKWIVSDIPGKFVYKKEHDDTAAWYMIVYVSLSWCIMVLISDGDSHLNQMPLTDEITEITEILVFTLMFVCTT